MDWSGEKKFLQADYDEFIDSLKEAAYKMSFEFKVGASSRGRNEKDSRHELLCLSPYLGISAMIFLRNQHGR